MSHSVAGPILRFEGVGKEYFGNRVLHDVNLAFRAGEIHALVGENGAGKSTLLNILFGMPVIHETGGYDGRVLLAGNEVRFAGPADAMEHGIGMVHQEFMLLPGLSVAENVKLHREPLRKSLLGRACGSRLDLVDRGALGAQARRALDRVGLSLDEWVPVEGLPVGHLQFVEIAREVDKAGNRVVVFDEPTAVLAEEEAERLLTVMRELAEDGAAVLFVTHRLDEVIAAADVATVLRDGRVVWSGPARDTTPGELAERMVGRPVETTAAARSPAAAGRPLLSLREFHVVMPGERVRGIDLEVGEGEILGLGGLAGHGKIGVANGVLGLFPATGFVEFAGRPLPLSRPAAALDRGIAFVSEDRRATGLMLDESIETNIAAGAVLGGRGFLGGPKLLGPLRPVRRREIRARALALMEELSIRATGPDQPVRRLSGGNQQKVCLARALTPVPRLLMVSEPTRGIDVGAKEKILDLLRRLRAEGLTILVTSSELTELRAVCDRIAILAEGRISAVLPPDAPARDFGLAMAGEALR